MRTSKHYQPNLRQGRLFYLEIDNEAKAQAIGWPHNL